MCVKHLKQNELNESKLKKNLEAPLMVRKIIETTDRDLKGAFISPGWLIQVTKIEDPKNAKSRSITPKNLQSLPLQSNGGFFYFIRTCQFSKFYEISLINA